MNVYNNNYGYPTGGYYNGMMFTEPPKLNMTQGLTPEQLKSLRKTSGFSLDIPQDEMWKAFCTHRYENKFAVTQDDEGNFTCSLCGTKFKSFNGDTKDARELVEKVIDLMETTKMQSLTLPQQTIQEFFQIEPVLRRLPNLYEMSINDFKRATGTNDGYMYGQENNGFAMYQTMINPMAGNGYYDPAMMNQPMYGAQPQYGMGQPMPGYPMNNGMMNQPMYNAQPQYGMGQQMQGYSMNNGAAPQGNPFNSNPAPVQQQQQPSSEPATNQVTVNKTLTD